jgi:hypothetical protein
MNWATGKMDRKGVLNKILESEPKGRRRMRRTLLRWLEDFANYLKK